MISFGLDLLGLGSKYWDLKATQRALPKGIAIGCFDGTVADCQFGDCMPKLRKLLASGKVDAVRVQLTYYKDHRICPDEIIKKLAPKYNKLAFDFPTTTIYLSPSCEHGSIKYGTVVSKQVAEAKMALCHQYAPLCFQVNSVWQGPLVSNGINERHGDSGTLRKPYLWSLDGTDACDIDAIQWNKDYETANIRFTWGCLFNLNDGEQPADPAKRKAAPSLQYLKAYLQMVQPAGNPEPLINGKKPIPIKKPLLYKVMSQGTNDQREQKPCLVLPEKDTLVEVVTYDLKKVGTLGYFGTFTGGLYRYYSAARGGSNLWGYEFAARAEAKSGNPWVCFRVPSTGHFYGFCHPGYRQGFFR